MPHGRPGGNLEVTREKPDIQNYTLSNTSDTVYYSPDTVTVGGTWVGAEPQENYKVVYKYKSTDDVQLGEKPMRRIVRIYIIDPDERVPDEKALLYESPRPFLTSATDEELYFQLPIMELLGEHNALRATLLDEETTAKCGHDTYLRPIRIRDLKMIIVTEASV